MQNNQLFLSVTGLSLFLSHGMLSGCQPGDSSVPKLIKHPIRVFILGNMDGLISGLCTKNHTAHPAGCMAGCTQTRQCVQGNGVLPRCC